MAVGPNYTGPLCGAEPKPGAARKWPCKKVPVLGQKRCRFHGGINKTTAARRAEVETERKIERAVRALNITPVDDPLTELKKLAGEVLAWKEEMGRHVLQLDTLRYRSENAEQIRGEIQLFERAMDRCASVLSTIAKLNIDERLAAISERQAAMLTQALFASFEAAGLAITDTDIKKAVSREFGRHLRVVGA